LGYETSLWTLGLLAQACFKLELTNQRVRGETIRATLAAELGIPYASLCIVTNMATGRWHLDPRRDFGPNVAKTGLRVLFAAD
jgi:hypothetical protein